MSTNDAFRWGAQSSLDTSETVLCVLDTQAYAEKAETGGEAAEAKLCSALLQVSASEAMKSTGEENP